jgi:MFS family permease
MSAELAATLPRAVLGRALGLIFGAYFFGNIVGSPLSGELAAAIGLRGAIAIAVLAFVASTAFVIGVRGAPPTSERARFEVGRTFWTLLAIAPFAAMLTSVSLVLLPVYLREVAAIPLERIGIYAGLVSLGAAVLAAANGRLADEIGPVPALVAGAGVLTAGAGLMALSGRTEPLLLLSAFLLGATQAANPVLAAAVERILPPTRVALGYSSYQLVFAIGFGGGGAVAGFLYETDPLLPLLVTVGLALPVAALIGVVLARALPRYREAL